MQLKLEITIEGYSSRVPESSLEDHLKGIAEEIITHAKDMTGYCWHRKININWEEQEDINLEISGQILDEQD